MSGRIWITAPILAALLLGGCRNAAPTPKPTAAATANPKPPVGWAATARGKKLVYPWSVVAGGVDSPATMQKAMQEDPVVLAHYQGLQPGNFRAQTLPSSRQGYISFRIRDKIYWTQRMVTLQAGETVLTDGQTMLRGRCGNMISASPRDPQAPAGIEPREVAMDLSVPAADLEISSDMAITSPVASAELVNPKQLGENPDVINSLQPPSTQDSLPPAWVTGGSPVSGGGIVALGNAGGGTPPTPSPSTPSPSIPVAPTEVGTPAPAPPLTVTSTPQTPIEIAPPMVMASLLILPETPNPLTPFVPLETYSFTPPASFYRPPASPQTPPSISYPPIDSPAAPPNTPPTSPPPPPSTPPENPQGPPPAGPPPNGPPTSDPPSFPPLEPPGVSVPEPSAWVLFALGIAGIALGSFRRKS